MMDGDPALNAWVLDWVTHALTKSPAAILDGNAFFPYPRSIALAEHMVSLAVINVFLSPFGSSPWFGYNVLIFLSYFVSAAGGFVLVREWTGSIRAGIWAGLFWGLYGIFDSSKDEAIMRFLAAIAFQLIALTYLRSRR